MEFILLMETLLSRLPSDLIARILPYTDSLQPAPLLQDIVHYVTTRTTLLKLYHQYWKVEWNQWEDEANNTDDMDWLINDIVAYANDHRATMYGYTPRMHEIVMRQVGMQDTEKVDRALRHLDTLPVRTQINVMLGLLTPLEREEVVMEFDRMYGGHS